MRESVGKTFMVALLLCVVCSVLVSSAAVVLRPTQAINKAMDKKRNILQAAGLYEEGGDIEALFASIEAKVVDLETGEYVEGVDAQAYDQRRAAKDPGTSVAVPAAKDLGSIKRRANQAAIYLVYKNDKVNKVILPIHGMGLWSTLYGFIALDARDYNTVKGLVYYEHAETPGLGGEVDNPNWKALWNGKLVFGDGGDVRLEVIKGAVNPAAPGSEHQVDGLSGATITARGVSNMLQYWLGAEGFGAYLARQKAQGERHG